MNDFYTDLGKMVFSVFYEKEKTAKYRPMNKDNMNWHKDRQVKLTPEEHAEARKKGAVWHFHFGRDGKQEATCAIWKSCDTKTGEEWYHSNTHRAWAREKTFKAALRRWPFIKSTA